MKKFFVGASMLLMTAACGPYTNVPAQIHVKSIEPSSVTVTYKTENNTLSSSFTNPTISFVGEPGSVGAVFSQAKITYYYLDPAKNGAAVAPGSVANQDLDINISIGTSNYKDPDDSKKIQLGTGAWLAPIVNRAVTDYGADRSSAAKEIVANIVLIGRDEAWFPITMEISIPINFVGDLN